MFSQSILLASMALPSTLAISLAAWSPRAEGLTSACSKVYNLDIPGCVATDFSGSAGCSSACYFSVNALVGQVQAACSSYSGNSVLANFVAKNGNGPQIVCPKVQTAASANTQTAQSSSQQAQKTTTTAAQQTTQAAKSTTTTAAAQTTETDSDNDASSTLTKTGTSASASASSDGTTVAVTTATVIPVASSSTVTKTTKTGTSTGTAASTGSSPSSTDQGSGGSPFTFNGDSSEPGVKSANGAVRGSVSGAALAAFVIGAVAVL